jgi:hypothetical protein
MASLLHCYNHNYFFLNLLYQPLIEMANRLIRIKDVATIASTSQSTVNQPLLDAANAFAQLTANFEKVVEVPLANEDDDDDIPELVPAPLSTLSPRTTAMVLEAAGPSDGAILLNNAKDLAATIRALKERLDQALDRAHSAEDRAQDCEDRANEVIRCDAP